MVISTGTTLPRWDSVAALYCLQKSMMLTPCGPSAVPTGGAGVAAPACSCTLTSAATFFFGGIFTPLSHLSVVPTPGLPGNTGAGTHPPCRNHLDSRPRVRGVRRGSRPPAPSRTGPPGPRWPARRRGRPGPCAGRPRLAGQPVQDTASRESPGPPGPDSPRLGCTAQPGRRPPAGARAVPRRRRRPGPARVGSESDLGDLVEGQLDRGLPAEDRHQHLQLLLLGVDLVDGRGEGGERAVHDGDRLADLELDGGGRLRLLLGRLGGALLRLGGEQLRDLVQAQRGRLVQQPHEPGHAGRV